MKPIIAFDMDGTIVSSQLSVNAYTTWFKVMSILLEDESVKDLAGHEDYMPYVMELMERLTGMDRRNGFDKEIMVKYARNVYQMIYLSELKKTSKEVCFPDVVDMIIDMKKTCRIALITTAPEDVVLPALEIGGIKKLFDYIYRGPLNQEPSKESMLKKFIHDVGKPALYIGNEKKDAEACKELGIKFALAKWDKHDEEAGKMAAFNLTSPKQLKGVLQLL